MNKRTLGLTALAIGGALVLAGGTVFAIAATPTPFAPVGATAGATPSPSGSVTLPAPAPSPSSSAPDDGRFAPGALDQAIAAALQAAGPGVVIDADIDDDATHAYEIDILLDAGGVAEVKLDASFAVVSMTHDDRGGRTPGGSPTDDLPRESAEFAAASAAALAHVGGGTVVEVERSDDDDHAYEVEIELPDGDDVDVELDANFTVLRAD